MDGIGRTCLGCQAELGPHARFCGKCGRPAGTAVPRLAPGGPVPGDQVSGPGEGPGFTIVAPPTAAPSSPGWNEPTATQTAFPERPYQAPLPPPTRPQALPGPLPSRAVPSRPVPSHPRPARERPAYEQGFREQPPQNPQGFGSFQPAVQPPPGPPPGAPRRPPRRPGGRRSGSSLALWGILLALLVGGGVAGVLIAHPFSKPDLREAASTGPRPGTPGGSSPGTGGSTAAASPAASDTGSTATSPTASPSATAVTAVTEQQAATSVASMLSQSVSDRASISNAASDVGDCGPSLASDAKVFDDAASSRESLLSSLTAMPGLAALPPALVSDLTKAWQASITADQAYAKWANDEFTQGCVPNDTTDPGYEATNTPNLEATQYKTAFVSEWNPIATQYGLTQYQQGQL
jgi:hypothetical protein